MFNHLEKILLKHGGNRVVDVKDKEIHELIKNGKLFKNKSKIILGLPCSCHSNSAIRYLNFYHCENNLKSCKICTGYALTDDGLWRNHSWVLENNVIIETTVKRLKYYGRILSPVQSVEFSIVTIISGLPDWNKFGK